MYIVNRHFWTAKEIQVLCAQRLHITCIVLSMLFVNTAIASSSISSVEVDKLLSYFQKTINKYYDVDSQKTRTQNTKQLFDDHNSWVKNNQAQLEMENKRLQHELNLLKEGKERIANYDELLSKYSQSSSQKHIAQHNEQLKERNKFVASHNQQVKQYELMRQKYNRLAEQYNTQSQTRLQTIEHEKRNYNKFNTMQRNWFNTKNDSEFFSSLNTLFAKLTNSAEKQYFQREIQKLTDMRRHLANYVRHRELEKDWGLIIVEASINNNFTGYFIVDTGANLVTISPEVIAILGLENQTGNEINTVLAGGTHATGRSIVLPLLEIQGQKAKQVEAIVLSSPSVGIDGLLGRSFLKRFAIIIDDTTMPVLRMIKH